MGLLAVMVIQTIIAPIPSEGVLIFAGAIGIDVFNIVVFGGTGLIMGSVIAFFIGRWGGRRIIKKFLGEQWTDHIDSWINKNGTKAILFTRLIPFIPFDMISYLSGATSLKFRNYFVATVLGAFPRCFILAIVGGFARDILAFLGVSLELTLFLGVSGFVVLVYLEKKGYTKFLERKIIKNIIKKIFKVI